MADFPLRYVATLLALVALVPVVLFTLDRGEGAVWLSFVSVLVIASSLFVMLSPTGDRGADHAGAE